MPTAEPHGARPPAGVAHGVQREHLSTAPPASQHGRGDSRRWAWPALGAILLVALGLRLWGIKQGLPYVYNIDEAGHFVPKAVAMFSGGLNPHYFVNPPALTYVLHVVFAAWLDGARGVQSTWAHDPASVYLLARVVVALFSVASIWLLYLFGACLLGRGTALLAAAIEAVAFLAVFYGHFALNDAFTLAPLTLSLFGSAGVLQRGRRRDYALAGIGLGLGCASKYTAGIVLLPLLAAAAARYLDSPAAARRVAVGLAIAAACALGGFLIANPYSLLDFADFHSELLHQSSLTEEAQGKLGAPKESGILYYLWSFTWGLGWAPALAALGGAIAIWRRDARLGWLLVPAPLVFLAFMGAQDRYFGRWLLPIFPIVCLLAAYFAALLAKALIERLSRGRPSSARSAIAVVAGALVVGVLLVQGALFSVHSDIVLARADTRNLARDWMIANVPRGSKIVLEPVVPNAWISQRGPLAQSGPDVDEWSKYEALRSVIAPDGALALGSTHTVPLEDYELTLSPALIGLYERLGYCWVVTGSTEWGRAFADPRAAPEAVAYYHALQRDAQLVYHVSPFSRDAPPEREPVKFSFDWTFDYYPLAYERPGPEMSVYRLRGGACARTG